jgi:hypothetical protein
MPKLGAHGLAFVSFPGTGSDGKLCLTYYLTHAGGGYIMAEFPLKGEGGIQAIGGAITYARRYCFQAATGVAAEEDDDAAAAQAAEQANGPTVRRNRARADRAAANTERVRRERSSGGDDEPGDERPAAVTSGPRNPDAPVSTDQQRKLFAQFRDLGYGERDQRDARLAIVSGLMRRPVESISNVTSGEAHTLIDKLTTVIAAGETPTERAAALAAALEDASHERSQP